MRPSRRRGRTACACGTTSATERRRRRLMYLRNGWYCAGWASELGPKPVGRRMLGEPVMVYRTEGGEPVALEGRCPHRFAPLHLGTVENDRVACPYHGLVFDSSGACVLNPHGEIPT